jgi:hypothetical protein
MCLLPRSEGRGGGGEIVKVRLPRLGILTLPKWRNGREKSKAESPQTFFKMRDSCQLSQTENFFLGRYYKRDLRESSQNIC